MKIVNQSSVFPVHKLAVRALNNHYWWIMLFMTDSEHYFNNI